MSKQLISNTLNKILGKQRKIDIYSFNNHYAGYDRDTHERHDPEPEYKLCNAGHPLVEVFNERLNRWVWDCPTCINKMRRAYNR